MRSYIAIDLKSFFASVECVERGLDPLTTHLVVADISRTEKTICLAVSPSLKSYGIAGRARLFEVVQRVREVNFDRQKHASGFRLINKSYSAVALSAHPDWAVDYIVATPQMSHYMECSARIYAIYLKYVAPEDIFAYSIDEVFIDVTNYLKTYKMTPHELAVTMVRDVLAQTGITATAGIGTNLYLSKVAMDIEAKHLTADKDGVRIAELDEMSYRRKLWHHTPLTDFWRIGPNVAKRLIANGMNTMGDVARCSLDQEELLYKLFGINAELLIDHAWGWEPVTIAMVKAYKPESKSSSNGQVLQCGYPIDKARIVVREMTDALALSLVDKHCVANQMVLTIGYDTESLANATVRTKYQGTIVDDRYGRQIPASVHGTVNLERYTASSCLMIEAVLSLFDKIVNADLLVRRINICANHVVYEGLVIQQHIPVQLDLFTDYDSVALAQQQKEDTLNKEHKMQETLIYIKKKYGKNAILKGTSFEDGATAKERNQQIGGHKA